MNRLERCWPRFAMIGLDYFENFKYILSLQDIIYLYLLFGPVNRNQKFDYPCIGGGVPVIKFITHPFLAIFVCYYKHFSFNNRLLWHRYRYASFNSNVRVWPQIILVCQCQLDRKVNKTQVFRQGAISWQ